MNSIIWTQNELSLYQLMKLYFTIFFTIPYGLKNNAELFKTIIEFYDKRSAFANQNLISIC